MNSNEKNIYIDTNIPLEQQIAFLRRSVINLKINVFEVLKEKLENDGIEIFKTIVRLNIKQATDKHNEKSFEEIKKIAGLSDRIFGYQTKHDYTKSDELQYLITYCPYLEESKQRGLGMDFCNVNEDIEIEEFSKYFGEITEPTRMCQGDSICTIRMKNSLGR